MCIQLNLPKRAAALVLGFVFAGPVVAQVPTGPERGREGLQPSSAAWTLEDALAQMRLYPRDAYLQYVALQIGRRENRMPQVTREIEKLTPRRAWRRGRSGQVNLFSMFSGALAVQESLQLDAMTGRNQRPEVRTPEVRTPGARSPVKAQPASGSVPVSALQGPTVKSHPWTQMLAGRRPKTSKLARSVPADFYFIQFGSVNKLLSLMQQGDLWGTHVFSQSAHKAYRHELRPRTMKQLAIETNRLLQPFYDLAVQEIAVTGSDLFAIEGSDVTLLFHVSQPRVFQAQMNGFLLKAEQSSPGVIRKSGTYRGVSYDYLTTPNRSVHVFSAYPAADLHVRSNSLTAFRRVIDTIVQSQHAGANSLGATDEYAYIRTLMPYGSEVEDGFIYLSDPFIRHMVGPQLKLTEYRRRICLARLRMLGYAAAFYQTQRTEVPHSVRELVDAECLPSTFLGGEMKCPCGGEYSLAADGLTGRCSHHGTASFMTPCCEISLTDVSATEAEAYRSFEKDYSRYWRTFFDPIALRVQVTPERYRLETIVLPLIDNSLYRGLSFALGGPPERLDLPPIPDRNIFTVGIKLDKEGLLQKAGWVPPPAARTEAQKSRVAMLESTNNVRQLALAMHNYHDVYRSFPAIAKFDKEHRPLLSWRVHLLPFLEAQNLYREFHLDEPWDSPHNRKLIARMPAVFAPPGRRLAKPGMTTYVGIVGEETIFKGTDSPVKIRDIRDGTSNTLMLIDASDKHAVIWTKPNDVKFDTKLVRDALFGSFQTSGVAGFCDGSVRELPSTLDDRTLRALCTRGGGERVARVGEYIPRRRDRLFGLDEVFHGKISERDLYDFVVKGVGDRISLHTYDADPLFDLQLVGFLGQAMGNFAGRQSMWLDDDVIPFVMVIASLNSPVYLSVPLQDEGIADAFLEKADGVIAELVRRPEDFDFFEFNLDFYTLPVGEGVVARSVGTQVGPVKWRVFWARIGKSLYLASKPDILRDLAAATATRGAEQAGGENSETSDLKAHAMIRIRPQHWKQVLPAYRLGWAERNRLACIDNVGRLSALARVASGTTPADLLSADKAATRLDDLAAKLYGLHFYCPDHGSYVTSERGVQCSIHGSAELPRQAATPRDNGAIDTMLRDFSDLTVTLTFLEDGLHAVFVIDRKK